jgi:hypothetical protein
MKDRETGYYYVQLADNDPIEIAWYDDHVKLFTLCYQGEPKYEHEFSAVSNKQVPSWGINRKDKIELIAFCITMLIIVLSVIFNFLRKC